MLKTRSFYAWILEPNISKALYVAAIEVLCTYARLSYPLHLTEDQPRISVWLIGSGSDRTTIIACRAEMISFDNYLIVY